MGTVGYPETSVKNYHILLRYNTEELSSHLLRDGSFKSRIGRYYSEYQKGFTWKYTDRSSNNACITGCFQEGRI